MITYLMTAEEQKNFNPVKFVTKLKEAGFKLENESCPVKLVQPWDKIDVEDGVLWRQWEGKLFDIYYMKPEYARDGMMGYDFCYVAKRLPDPARLDKTHVFLKCLEAEDADDVWMKMQAHNWSPNGEARVLIAGKRLRHTSMSVGDVMVARDDPEHSVVLMVDINGFTQL